MRFAITFVLILALLAVVASGQQRSSKDSTSARSGQVATRSGNLRRRSRTGLRTRAGSANSGRSTRRGIARRSSRRRSNSVRPRFFGLLSSLGSSSSSSGLFGSTSTTSSTAWPATRCIVPTSGCNTNGTYSICAHWGGSTRQCKLFPNVCLMETANCRKTTSSWNEVRYNNCSNLNIGADGNCVSTFSGTTVASSTSSSTSSSSSTSLLSANNVRPVIINLG